MKPIKTSQALTLCALTVPLFFAVLYGICWLMEGIPFDHWAWFPTLLLSFFLVASAAIAALASIKLFLESKSQPEQDLDERD